MLSIQAVRGLPHLRAPGIVLYVDIKLRVKIRQGLKFGLELSLGLGLGKG